MDISELFELLDIESIEDFVYFDNMAALLESDENIPYDVIHELFYRLDPETAADLVTEYFTDITEGVPESEQEMFELLNNICTVMKGHALNTEDDTHMAKLADEVFRFRNWYNFDTDVVCSENKTGKRIILPVRDALMLYRQEKLQGSEYSYDFSSSCNYEIDEYIVPLEAGSVNDEYDYTSGNEEQALLDSDYLYDDEFELE